MKITTAMHRTRQALWLFLLGASGVACSGSKPPALTGSQTNPSAVVAASNDIVEARQGVAKQETVDSLILKVKRDDWNAFEQELRQYLAETKAATEQSDRCLADVCEAIEKSLNAADISDERYFGWRTKAARLILQNYEPLSTLLAAKLASHVSYVRVFGMGDLHLPDTEHRLADARLIQQALNQVRNRIDPDFDPDDPNNHGMMNVAVPGHGPYYPGIDPSKVAEPEVREKYVRAIAENCAKHERVNVQRDAREAELDLRGTIRRFVLRAYCQPPAAFAELEQLLDELEIGLTAKSRILSEARETVPRIEKRLKENQESQEKLAKLRAEGAID